MDELDRFFFEKNTIGSLSEIDSTQTNNYLEIIKAFSRLTYQSIYVIDYQNKSFEYVSDNPLFLCGMTPEEVKELGYGFYFRNVKDKDLDLIVKINEVGFDFFEKLPIDERKKYTISYDFHIENEKRNSILINHKLTPLFLTDGGKIWKAICIVSLSPNNKSGNIAISEHGSETVWNFDLSANNWLKGEKVKLDDREIEILRLYSQGLTINDIAEKIYLSPNTIKFHRKKLFEKIGVQNITEALSYATSNKLL